MSNPERWLKFRPLPPDIMTRLDDLRPLFEREAKLAYLFGSLANTGQGQDVDLALLSRQKPVHELRERLTDCLDTQRLDVVDLSQAPPLLRFEIIRSGKLLFAADPLVCEHFEMTTLQLYHDRAVIRARHQTYLSENIQAWLSE